jgi:hypothetical protein
VKRAASVSVVVLLAYAIAIGPGMANAARAAADPTTTKVPASGDLSPEAVQTAIDLSRTERRIAAIEKQLATTQARLADAQATLSLTEGFLSSNGDTVRYLRARAKADALDAYQRHSVTQSAVLTIHSAIDVDRGDQYIAASSTVDDFELQQLVAQQEQLEHLREQRAGARDTIAASARALRDQQAQLADLDQRERTELASWGGLPVMGQSNLTAAELARWYRSTGSTPKLAAGTTIDDVAQYFVQEGQDEGLRGDIAFAQSIIETAYFTVAAGNNFSGIGACDSCTGGLVFATPRDGVRAQIQLLRNYADPDSRATNLAHAPEPGLYGADPASAAHLYDTFFLKGKAPLWNMMGNGNWATDPVYAAKVVKLYAAMVAFNRGS